MSDPAKSETVIAARGLTKVYGTTRAVDGIDFELRGGEIVGLLGPNGAGKTTTILMMLGLTEPSGGTISVLGHDPLRDPLAVKRRVGYLPDSVGFYDHLSARENLLYTAKLSGMTRREARDRIDTALVQVRLNEVADRPVGSYSHGMKRRLGLAEVIMKNCQVAILDEPTSGLDPQSTHELLDMIRGLRAEGVTVLLSSHLLDRVQSICDRVALFHDGHIALMGTVEELGRQILGAGFAVVADAKGDGIAAKLQGIPGVLSVEEVKPGRYRLLADRDVLADVAATVASSGGRLTHLSIDAPSLESIYANYFQRKAQDGEGRHAA
jgi:ABC-2 type transport system ATP-binding protein